MVADEVGSLAQRTAQAAREIKTLINDSVEKVNSGGHLVDTAGKTMNDVVTQVRKVTIWWVRSRMPVAARPMSATSPVSRQPSPPVKKPEALVVPQLSSPVAAPAKVAEGVDELESF